MGQEEKEAGQHDVRSVIVHSPVGAGQQAQPQRGDGNGYGPIGTAMAAARGGTRQSWQREGGGDGDRGGGRERASEMNNRVNDKMWEYHLASRRPQR